MSTTNPINSAMSGKTSDTKKKASTIAAVGAAAAGVGVAGAAVLSDYDNEEEVILEDVILEEGVEESSEAETPNTTVESNTTSSQSSHHTSTVNASDSQTQDVLEPQPITEDGFVGEAIPGSENIDQAGVQSQTSATSNTETATSESTEELVNPEEIAQAIISEEQIDPDDVDMADVVNFDDIGTVYTVDGESYTAAAFHDAAGNDLVMIDVDGDNVFDVITDYDGNLIAEVPGNISVGDAMEDILEDETYFAYDSETDNVDEFDTDSLTEDILA